METKNVKSFQHILDADLIVPCENASAFLARVSEHLVVSWACRPYFAQENSLLFNLRLPAGVIYEDGVLATSDSVSSALFTLNQFSDLGDVINVSTWSPDFVKAQRENVQKK